MVSFCSYNCFMSFKYGTNFRGKNLKSLMDSFAEPVPSSGQFIKNPSSMINLLDQKLFIFNNYCFYRISENVIFHIIAPLCCIRQTRNAKYLKNNKKDKRADLRFCLFLNF